MYVPLRQTRKRNASSIKYPPSISRKLRKKANAWRVYRQFRTPESHSSYKRLAAECRKSISEYVAKLEERLVDHGNLGAFYRYSNNKFSFKSAVGALVNNSGTITNDPSAKAELLQQVFTSNFTHDNDIMPTSNSSADVGKISSITFSPLLVRRAIKRLKLKTKGGTDGIPPIFI